MSEGKRLPERLLLGPGPSNVPVRVREAISRPLVGHLDPEFLKLMSELQELLRWAYRTKNRMTIPVSGTGTAGMECAVYNFVEEGDAVLVGVHGYFGGRIAEMARRAGAEVTVVSSPFGEPLEVDALSEAADRVKPKVIAFVHAETSTGV
ncbi:MAG: aminotransferase class V-fold PLP-dependent enzyme, partial [Acidobacteriota bacterium]